MNMMYYCYILYNLRNNKTYNGSTNNLARRIRQHNGEIKGGAKFTTADAKKSADHTHWKWLAICACEDQETFDKIRALSLEWHIKYPDNKRPRPSKFQGRLGRIEGLELALSNPKFAGFTFCVYVCEECLEHATQVIQHGRVLPMHELFEPESNHRTSST